VTSGAVGQSSSRALRRNRHLPFWGSIVALIVSSSAAAASLPNCGVSIYSVSEGGALGTRLIQPEHVLRVEPYNPGRGETVPEIKLWLVKLGADGAQIMRDYSARNLGGMIAVKCDTEEVSRPFIRSIIDERFVFSVVEHGH
jgi:preprotein translocase subunit SecD